MKGKVAIPGTFVFLFLPLFLLQNLQAEVNRVTHDTGLKILDNRASQGNPQQAIQNFSTTEIVDAKLNNEEFVQKTKKLQIPFIANNGQVDDRVRFYANTFGGTVFVTKDGEIVYALPNNNSDVETLCLVSSMCSPNGMRDEIGMVHDYRVSDIMHPASWIVDHDKSKFQNRKSTSSDSKNLKSSNPKSAIQNLSSTSIRDLKSGVAIKETLIGSRVQEIAGNETSVTKVNYFKGNDTSRWKTNISTYDVVSLGEVYDGIELTLKAYGNNVEKLFCVKPGANPDQIQVMLSGAKGLRVNDEGQLVAETELGAIIFTKPLAYQEIVGKMVYVDAEYFVDKSEVGSKRQKVKGNRLISNKEKGMGRKEKYLTSNLQPPTSNPKSEYGFKIAAYDRTKELIIDPLLASTYLGGSKIDESHSIAINSSGDIYVAGNTYSPDFPTTLGAYDISFNGAVGDSHLTGDQDAFISRLNGDLTNLIASTYLGGSGEDIINSLAIDTDGNVYAGGETSSSNFPTVSGAYDTSHNGGADAFVLKLNGNLTDLLASTYLGGLEWEECSSITIDPIGNIYLSGRTYSTNFPTTVGAYDTSYNGCGTGCGRDAFISKLNGDLTSLLASTYLGGFYDDGVLKNHSMTINTGGDIYVAGFTYSIDFPTTPGAYDTSYNGDRDTFVSRLNGDLTNLLTSTYIGGNADDLGLSMSLDSVENIYLAGMTYSANFPTTTGVYDTSYGGSGDTYVSKLSANLTTLIASTFLGGSGYDQGTTISMDSGGNIVAGHTYSIDFPTTFGSYDISYNGDSDAFVSKFNGNLTSLIASTYLGGTYLETVSSIAINSGGKIYVAGHTGSSDFPTTYGAYDQSHNGIYDIFISKLDSKLSDDTTPPTVSSTNPANNATDVAINSTITATFSEVMDPSSINDTTFTVSGVTGIVTFDGNTTATFTPSSPLTYYTTYTATIMAGVMDVAGNHIASDYTWSFTTESMPSSPIPTPFVTPTTTPIATVMVTPTPTHIPTPIPTTTLSLTPTPLITPTPIITPTIIPSPLPSPTAEMGMIYGYVVDTGGNPIESANLKIKGKKTKTKETTSTDANGFFEFKNLEADTYEINAKKKHYKKAKQEIKLGKGEKKEIEITMKKLKKDDPTVITLIFFSANASIGGIVTLNWETATEVNNAGFNLYRARQKNSTYSKINSALISAKGNSTAGASYSHEDKPGAGTFYYKLEDVDISGVGTMHEPIRVKINKK